MAKYYVSPDGNDAWSGLTDSDPFATLEHAHSRANVTEISAREDFVQLGFTPQKAGTLENRIVFTSYGLGVQKPTITGKKKLEGWTGIGGGLFKHTDTGFLDRIKFLLVDGVQSTVATYPRDREYYQITGGSGSSDGTLSDSVNLSGKNFTGGEVVTKKVAWVVDTMNITNHSGSTLTFTGGSSGYNVNTGYGYFVQNHRSCCTQVGDWCQEGDDIVMYFGVNDPDSYEIYAPYLERIHFNSRGHNHFQGFRFEMFNGGSDFGNTNPAILMHNSPNVKFVDCEFENFGNTVFYFEASNNNGFSLSNCTAINCLNIFFWSRYSSQTYQFEIDGLVAENIGYILGSGGNGDIGYSGINFAGSTNGGVVSNTYLTNIGYNGVNYAGYDFLLDQVYVENACSLMDDGGCFYTYGKGDIAKEYDSETRIVRNCIGINSTGTNKGKPSYFAGTALSYANVEAFYNDDDSNNITQENNVGVNCRMGVKFHNNQGIISTGNLFVGNKAAQIIFANNNLGTYKNRDITFTNNILYAEENQLIITADTIDTESGKDSDYGLIGIIDNNHYLRPSNQDDIIRITKNGTGSGTWFYNLQEIRDTYGHDLNSKGTPTTSTVYEIALNDTLGHIVYPLERIRIDPDGLQVNEPFGLDSLTAKLLMDDLGPIDPVPVEEYTITLVSATGGIATGGGAYDEGDTATLVAMQNMDYQFDGWSEGGSIVSTDNPWSFVVTGDRTITPVFTAVIPPPVEYTVTVISGNGGSVSGAGTYTEDDEATLTATPNTGWHFVRWSNDVTDNPYTFTVTGDVTLQAIFAQDEPVPAVIIVKGKFRIV